MNLKTEYLSVECMHFSGKWKLCLHHLTDVCCLACCKHKLRHFSWYVTTPRADEAAHQMNFMDYDSQAVCSKVSSVKTNNFTIIPQRKHEV